MADGRVKYTEEVLTEAVANSHSYCDVLRHLGLAVHGGNVTYFGRRIRKLGIDISHFDHGKRKLRSMHWITNWDDPISIDTYLRLCDSRLSGNTLKRALRRLGIAERCVLCGLGSTWNGNPLSLQVDHIDGNALNQAPENLRWLCPNCHSQTETFGGRNVKRAVA